MYKPEIIPTTAATKISRVERLFRILKLLMLVLQGHTCPSNFSRGCFYALQEIHAVRLRLFVVFNILISGGSKGAPGTRAPWGSKFLHFQAVFGTKIG